MPVPQSAQCLDSLCQAQLYLAGHMVCTERVCKQPVHPACTAQHIIAQQDRLFLHSHHHTQASTTAHATMMRSWPRLNHQWGATMTAPQHSINNHSFTNSRTPVFQTFSCLTQTLTIRSDVCCTVHKHGLRSTTQLRPAWGS